jgi:glycosyltransferase involved in cell wall biosynthesis
MKFSPERVAIIVPCFNEERVIHANLEVLVQAGFTVIAINDGSEDLTEIEANKTGAKVLSHLINLGQGAALETGLSYVRKNLPKFDVAVTFDADGQHKFSDIYVLLEVMDREKVNIVLGNRFKNKDFGGGWLKAILIRLSALLARFTLRIVVGDRHNGLRAFDSEAIKQIVIRDSGYGHADEILRIIVKKHLSYCEAPVSLIYTKYSKSKGQPLYNIYNLLFDRTFNRT